MATKKTKPAAKPARKSSVKTAAKETPRKATSAKAKTQTHKEAPVKETTTPRRSFRSHIPSVRVKRTYLIVAAVVIVLFALLFYFRNFFVVAVVNGQPITRLAYIHELEQTAGKQAMNSLITKTLILQEARKKHVTVSQKEVDDQINTIKDNLSKQGQSLDSVLALQGMTLPALREQIYLQKLIEKMVGNDVKVTDKEVADYISQNKDNLPQGTSEADLKKQVEDQLRQQKLNDKVQTWLQDLQQKAKISNFIS